MVEEGCGREAGFFFPFMRVCLASLRLVGCWYVETCLSSLCGLTRNSMAATSFVVFYIFLRDGCLFCTRGMQQLAGKHCKGHHKCVPGTESQVCRLLGLADV